MSLFFAHADDLPAQQGSADNFTGTVYFQSVAAGQEEPVAVNRVTFEHGGRMHWHTHSGEQVLYFLAQTEHCCHEPQSNNSVVAKIRAAKAGKCRFAFGRWNLAGFVGEAGSVSV